MLSTPSGLLVSLVTNSFVVYHEHDSPNPEGAGGRTGFQKLLRWTRRLLVRRAGAVVLPNAERAAILVRETGLINPAIVIWNCPRLDEVGGPRVDPLDRIWLFYHGSLGPERLPVHIIDVLARLPERVGLRVVGYETLGSVGYLDRLRARARALGCAHRLETPGTIPTRRELLAICRASDIGMALMPMDTKDINLKAMTGASNKVFDYMASGLALIVSDLPDWRLTFCDEGLAVPCDPRRVDHLAAAIEGLVGDPVRLRQMGERGRQRVVRDWNYEAQMQPLLDLIAKRRQSLDS